MDVDAIVNAANTELRMGGGVCGAIFSAAGAAALQEECDAIGRIETGQAVLTKGYALPAKYISHTAGPVWHGGGQGEKENLENCYRNSLKLAAEHGLHSVAFPVISSGIYGYPQEDAVRVATETIEEFLRGDTSDMEVYLVVFGRA
jgi:O-acetyl-ADP-ribose deacetylase (regulator of RNase III)